MFAVCRLLYTWSLNSLLNTFNNGAHFGIAFLEKQTKVRFEYLKQQQQQQNIIMRNNQVLQAFFL